MRPFLLTLVERSLSSAHRSRIFALQTAQPISLHDVTPSIDSSGMPHGTCRTCVREERLLREVFGFVKDALCGTLLTLSLPALLVDLLFGWLDHDLSWAVKWALTVLGLSATALYWIFLKIHRMNITGRKTSFLDKRTPFVCERPRGRTLVTIDRRTIRLVRETWAEEQQMAAMILVDASSAVSLGIACARRCIGNAQVFIFRIVNFFPLIYHLNSVDRPAC